MLCICFQCAPGSRLTPATSLLSMTLSWKETARSSQTRRPSGCSWWSWSLRQVPSEGRLLPPCLPSYSKRRIFCSKPEAQSCQGFASSSTATEPNGAEPDASLTPNPLTEHRHNLSLTHLAPHRRSPFQRLQALSCPDYVPNYCWQKHP